MTGILAVNHFLKGSKYDQLHQHLITSAKNSGINLILKTNLELATDNVTADFVLFWDKDINLAIRLEKQGLPVFNSSRAIELCDDKARTYIELQGVVPQPKTIIAPKCYFKEDMRQFAENAVSILGLPVVFKECFGSFGWQVHLCSSVDEILNYVTEKPFLLQQYIKESSGRDIRVEVVGGKCVSAVERFNENDFRSNVTNGGTMTPYSPTELEIATAVTACEKLGLTFGGVDILTNGMVCEVNSNAHIINIMNSTNVDIAPFIFEEIRSKI
jgi:RimK family alpha-L-glutamate ligase